MPESTFHAVALVEIEGLSGRTNPVQRQMRDDLDEVIRTALAEAGLDPARIAQEDRGEAVLLIDPDVSVLRLAGRFVHELDDGLRDKARTRAPIARTRVRMALHQGICEYNGESTEGTAVETATLLVGAPPLRAALAAADRANIALIVSHQVFDGVIKHDYRSVDSSTFERVAIDPESPTGDTAWIQVPGYTYPPAVTPAPPPGPESPGPQQGPKKAKRPKDQPAQRGIIFNGRTEITVEGDFVNKKVVNGGSR